MNRVFLFCLLWPVLPEPTPSEVGRPDKPADEKSPESDPYAELRTPDRKRRLRGTVAVQVHTVIVATNGAPREGRRPCRPIFLLVIGAGNDEPDGTEAVAPIMKK